MALYSMLWLTFDGQGTMSMYSALPILGFGPCYHMVEV